MQFNQKFSRRRFVQLTIASSTVVGLGYATKTLAQQSKKETPTIAETSALTTVLLGVLPVYPANTNQPKIDTTDNSQLIVSTDSSDGTEEFAASATATSTVSSTAAVKPARELVLKSIDLTTDLTTNTQRAVTSTGISLDGDNEARSSTGIILNENADALQPYKKVSGLASLSNGKIVVATNPTNVNKKGNPTRITVSQSGSIKTLEVLGLKKQDVLESLAGTNTDQLFGLVVSLKDKGDARLVAIDINTGQIDYTEKVKLPGNERFSTLTQCSDSIMYTTSTARSGVTTLVQLDLNQKKPVPLAQLSLDGKPWISGLKSLACSGASQLFALGSGRYETRNSLFLIDAKTGKMTRLREFDAVRAAFKRE